MKNAEQRATPDMLDSAEFRQIVSGRRQGWLARLLRCGLRLAELPYSAAVEWRNRHYDRGSAPITRLAIPVISVGNLTLGGTGKTPTIAWLARWFRQHQVSVALVSRGYGAKRQASAHRDSCGPSTQPVAVQNDEAIELRRLLPEVPHVQNADRVAAAQQALTQYHPDLILLDDAFQHRRLHRDLDIVLIDACEPDGFGHVFPRGTLREPLAGLRRADVVILSRADMVDHSQRQAIWDRLAPLLANHAIQLEAVHQPTAWLGETSPPRKLDLLRGKRVAAFCGIGNPTGFRHSLETCRCHILEFHEFPDHHAYRSEDLRQLDDWIVGLTTTDARPDAVVCTLKDLVKIDRDAIGGLPLFALEIGLQPLEENRAAWDALARLLEKFATSKSIPG